MLLREYSVRHKQTQNCRPPTWGQMGQNLHSAQDPSWPSWSKESWIERFPGLKLWYRKSFLSAGSTQRILSILASFCQGTFSYLRCWYLKGPYEKLMIFWKYTDCIFAKNRNPIWGAGQVRNSVLSPNSFQPETSVSLEKEGQFRSALVKEVAIYN